MQFLGNKLALDAAKKLLQMNIKAEVIDLKIINPFDVKHVIKSVKAGRLISVDVSWKSCGVGGEVIAGVFESVNPSFSDQRRQESVTRYSSSIFIIS